MSGAFQSSAFQNSAFQSDASGVIVRSGTSRLALQRAQQAEPRQSWSHGWSLNFRERTPLPPEAPNFIQAKTPEQPASTGEEALHYVAEAEPLEELHARFAPPPPDPALPDPMLLRLNILEARTERAIERAALVKLSGQRRRKAEARVEQLKAEIEEEESELLLLLN